MGIQSSHSAHGKFGIMRFACLLFLTWVSAAWPVLGADNPLVLENWPGKVPDESGDIGPGIIRMSPKFDRKQSEMTEPTKMITGVAKPSVTVYRPAKDKTTGTAMLICPGGGYWNLYWQLEGEEVAAWLNSIGITGIILKYRVPRRPDEPEGEPARRPLQDAQRALSLVDAPTHTGLAPIRIVSAWWVFQWAAIWPWRRRPPSRTALTIRSMMW